MSLLEKIVSTIAIVGMLVVLALIVLHKLTIVQAVLTFYASLLMGYVIWLLCMIWKK